MSTILVTGATGRVGRDLAAALPPGAVRRATRRPRGAGETRFDFADAATFLPALEGVDRVFLMRPPAMADPARGMAGFVRAMAGAGVGHVVVMSVLGADRLRLLPHRGMERLVRESGLAHTLLRPADFMQNLSTVHREAVRSGTLALPAGRGRSAMVDTRDVADAAAVVLRDPAPHAGAAVDLTGPRALDFFEVAETLTRALGRPVRYRPVSPLRFLWRERGRGLPMAAVATLVYTVQRLGLVDVVSDGVERLTGRVPRDLETFAREHADAWTKA